MTTPANATTTFQTGDNVIAYPFMGLWAAIKKLDPYLEERLNGVVAGTPGFMPPEAGSGTGTDADNLTNFYRTVRRTSPEVAELLRDVFPTFRRFQHNYLIAYRWLATGDGLSESSHAKELMTRLDIKTFRTILEAINGIATLLADIKWDPIYDRIMHPLIKSFNHFKREFTRVAKDINELLSNEYEKAQPHSWDTTRPREQFADKVERAFNTARSPEPADAVG